MYFYFFNKNLFFTQFIVGYKHFHYTKKLNPVSLFIYQIILFLLFSNWNNISAQVLSHRVFYIEKSHGENQVHYDVKVGSDGKFLAKNTMDGYWYHRTEKKRYELNWIEQILAYGFDYELNIATNTIAMKMRALKKRPVKIYIKDHKPVAELMISGHPAILEKVYIKVAKQLYPPLEYIEIIGTEIANGHKIVERVYPKQVL